MRKLVVAAPVIAIGLFGVGYAIGQVHGATPGDAASTGSSHTWIDRSMNGTSPRFGSRNAGPRADGTVTAISGNTITVKADSDQGQTNEYGNVTTIQVTGSTQYEADHDGTASTGKSAIKVGSYIIARGTLSGDAKTLNATSVSVRADGAGPGGNVSRFEHPDGNTSRGNAPVFQTPGGNDSGGSI